MGFGAKLMVSFSDGKSRINEDFLKLESILCELVQCGNLHWRHHKMALEMLLTMVCSDHKPSEKIVNLWLDCLLHDHKNIRIMAFQVLKK